MQPPTFFIIGAPKCGTTALYYMLKAHPQIFMCEVKEPRYFNTDLRSRFSLRFAIVFSLLVAEERGPRRES